MCHLSHRSWWSGVEQGPPDAIFGLVEAHKKDPRPEKVSLAIGAYRDSEGKPLVLPTARKVSIRVALEGGGGENISRGPPR